MAVRVETAQARTARRPARAQRRRLPWGSIARHGILVTTCAVILFPLFWVLLLSIKSLPDAYTNRIWPRNFEFGSYSQRADLDRDAAAEPARTASSSRSRRC